MSLPMGCNVSLYQHATPMTDKPLEFHGSLFRKKRSKDKSPPLAVHQSSSSSLNLSSSTPALSDGVSAASTDSRPSTAFRTNASSPRESSVSSLSFSDLKGHIRRRSASIRSRAAPSSPDKLAHSQPADSHAVSTTSLRPTLNVVTSHEPHAHSSDSVPQTADGRSARTPASAVDQKPLRSVTVGHGPKRDNHGLRPPTAVPTPSSAVPRNVSQVALHNPQQIFQNIQDVASKRISTLDYLRKAHEGRVFWFNALRFTKEDLHKMPYFDSRKLGRRAANYLLLGISIPAILDPNKDAALEYLRGFNSLLNEFESYQAIHSPDGAASTSISRGRIPQMFKRAAHPAKGRRGSAVDNASPQSTTEAGDARTTGGIPSAASTASYTSFPASDQELLPGEEYSFLQTPSLPFDPDYFETFATLCEVLIDCYVHIMNLVNSPDAIAAGLGDIFSKADAKVRKILVASLVRDFEEASKQGIKSELAGVGKVVLGGLM